jgi:hypothetical protein
MCSAAAPKTGFMTIYFKHSIEELLLRDVQLKLLIYKVLKLQGFNIVGSSGISMLKQGHSTVLQGFEPS